MSSGDIDLKEAARLVGELERDLQKVSAGSEDIEKLRDEVEALRTLLGSSGSSEKGLRTSLHAVQQALQRAIETVEGEAIRDWPYIAEIGRILGLR